MEQPNTSILNLLYVFVNLLNERAVTCIAWFHVNEGRWRQFCYCNIPWKAVDPIFIFKLLKARLTTESTNQPYLKDFVTNISIMSYLLNNCTCFSCKKERNHKQTNKQKIELYIMSFTGFRLLAHRRRPTQYTHKHIPTGKINNLLLDLYLDWPESFMYFRHYSTRNGQILINIFPCTL